MPELPEVETTTRGLAQNIVGLRIKEVWSDYGGSYFKHSDHIKNPLFFKNFKKTAEGKKVISVERRAKNILINLEDGHVILIHMKMTGHLLFGRYKFNPKLRKDPWEPISPESLKDPFNRRIHFMITFENGSNLALSDMRTFAKVTLLHRDRLENSVHLAKIGPEPLNPGFSFEVFKNRILRRPNAQIKIALMDQSVLAGIGNIYADETLWDSNLHPLSKVGHISSEHLKVLYKSIRKLLTKSISLGGDSMSDYRNINGEKGGFQNHHKAYKRKGQKCGKAGCTGVITRIVVGGRGTHFCPVHQPYPNNLL